MERAETTEKRSNCGPTCLKQVLFECLYGAPLPYLIPHNNYWQLCYSTFPLFSFMFCRFTGFFFTGYFYLNIFFYQSVCFLSLFGDSFCVVSFEIFYFSSFSHCFVPLFSVFVPLCHQLLLPDANFYLFSVSAITAAAPPLIKHGPFSPSVLTRSSVEYFLIFMAHPVLLVFIELIPGLFFCN